MFPYISGILAAILPNLSYEAEDITRKDVTQQEHKRKLITLFDTQIFEIMVWNLNSVLNKTVFGREFCCDPKKIDIRQALKIWKIFLM